MKIILSRKGFDSASGGRPSPILPDERMVSLPIPDRQSPIRYRDIRWQEHNLGALVSDLTDGRVPASWFAHLDPDLSDDSLPRHAGWKPMLGQTGIAQGHLQRNGVQPCDVFLFFGLFRRAIHTDGKFKWDRDSLPRHVLWGWLQIGGIVTVDDCDLLKYEWAAYHPHFHRGSDENNTVYVARKRLAIPGMSTGMLHGAGVFPRFSRRLQLTASSVPTPSRWELPEWFYPCDGRQPLTYHPDLNRWQRTRSGTRLNTVGRGQEFIFDTEEYPEATQWLKVLLEST